MKLCAHQAAGDPQPRIPAALGPLPPNGPRINKAAGFGRTRRQAPEETRREESMELCSHSLRRPHPKPTRSAQNQGKNYQNLVAGFKKKRCCSRPSCEGLRQGVGMSELVREPGAAGGRRPGLQTRPRSAEWPSRRPAAYPAAHSSSQSIKRHTYFSSPSSCDV